MNEIMVMYADGALGNKSVAVGVGTLTAGVFNYIKSSNSQPYTLKSVLGNVYPYYFDEPKESASESLLMFMTQAPEFNMEKFKGK